MHVSKQAYVSQGLAAAFPTRACPGPRVGSPLFPACAPITHPSARAAYRRKQAAEQRSL